jgi:hypothetical protein
VDLYTLTPNFLDKDVIDDFVSAIWTERYSSAGDTQLVVQANDENVSKLAPGTYLALRGTKEVMELQTQDIESGLLKVVGASMLQTLNQRIIWFRNPSYTSDGDNGPKIVDYSDDTKKIGAFLADVVTKMAINPVTQAGLSSDAQLDWDFEKLDHLSLGPTDAGGVVERYTIPTGGLYDGIKTLAEQEELGVRVYLDSADPILGYDLKFSSYRGKDRTTGGTDPLVRLSPDMDTLSGLKEVRSIAMFKNVCYVWYQNKVYTRYLPPWSDTSKPEGFERRSMVTDAEGEPVGHKVQWGQGIYGGGGGWSTVVVDTDDINKFIDQNAKDAFANNNYIQAIDGETSPMSDYKYGVDYDLGDLIELVGITGATSKARVIEYIRSQDAAGEREYPTISVIQ